MQRRKIVYCANGTRSECEMAFDEWHAKAQPKKCCSAGLTPAERKNVVSLFSLWLRVDCCSHQFELFVIEMERIISNANRNGQPAERLRATPTIFYTINGMYHRCEVLEWSTPCIAKYCALLYDFIFHHSHWHR